jgi:DNA-binding transcriptional LysR family regulator
MVDINLSQRTSTAGSRGSRLLAVDVRHLAALVAVAEERSFGRAAQRLGFTQSAVSQQIAAFERGIGTALFDRPGGPLPVEITPAGEALLPHARAILERLDAADAELDRLLAGEGGRITIGTFQSVSVKALPIIIGRLRAERPDLEIRLVESDDNDELQRRTLDGELDVSFIVFHDDTDERLDFEELCRDPFVAISRATDELPAVLGKRELSTTSLIGQHASSCQLLIDRGLQRMDVAADYVFRSNDNAAVQAMVRAGMGVAIMPWLAIDPDDAEVGIHELDPPLAPRIIGLIRRRGRTLSPATARFVEIAREVAAELHPIRV